MVGLILCRETMMKQCHVGGCDKGAHLLAAGQPRDTVKKGKDVALEDVSLVTHWPSPIFV